MPDLPDVSDVFLHPRDVSEHIRRATSSTQFWTDLRIVVTRHGIFRFNLWLLAILLQSALVVSGLLSMFLPARAWW